MRRKISEFEQEIMEMDNYGVDNKWGVLQETLSEKDIKANELKREKVWVKEGACEECGAFDVLSRINDRFVCSECTKVLTDNTKSRKRK